MKIIIGLSLPRLILEEYAYFVLYYVISRPHFKNRSEQEIWCNAQKDPTGTVQLKTNVNHTYGGRGRQKPTINQGKWGNKWSDLQHPSTLLPVVAASRVRVKCSDGSEHNRVAWSSVVLSFMANCFSVNTEDTASWERGSIPSPSSPNLFLQWGKLTWCPLNHSCFPRLLQQCPLGRVLSAPSPTSSVSGKSPEQQEKPLSCGKDSIYKKKYLLNSCLRLIALQCVGQKIFHEQTRVEW